MFGEAAWPSPRCWSLQVVGPASRHDAAVKPLALRFSSFAAFAPARGLLSPGACSSPTARPIRRTLAALVEVLNAAVGDRSVSAAKRYRRANRRSRPGLTTIAASSRGGAPETPCAGLGSCRRARWRENLAGLATPVRLANRGGRDRWHTITGPVARRVSDCRPWLALRAHSPRAKATPPARSCSRAYLLRSCLSRTRCRRYSADSGRSSGREL